jgi:molybdopterin-binding protein
MRIGEAAEVLGVSVDTVRRWAAAGTLPTTRSTGGQRLVAVADVRRLAAARRRSVPERPIAAQSARNRFPGVVTRVEADRVAAVVEVQAGPHRLVSLLTAEAVRELGLAPGVPVVAVVKATNVMIDLPA